MMRALFSGVSGLSNNQLKMDVIGNNIANINTVGFKSSRISFSEELSQLLRGAQATSSGGSQNAILIGLGVRAGNIERDFRQGILQATGKITDVGLDGEGFFVLSDGSRNVYTRAGIFHFDGNGRMVSSSGVPVQGWTANLRGEISQTASLGNVVVDVTVISPAVSTQNVAIAGNLDATAAPVAEQWTANTILTLGSDGSTAVATTALNSLTETTTALVAGDQIDISGTNSDGSAVSAAYTYAAGDTIQDLLDAITASFTGTATLNLGRIVLTDLNFTESSTTISLSENAGNTGAITLPGFVNSAQGFSPKSSSSVEIFDSLGSKHTMNITFTKTATSGEWTFAISLAGSETITAGSAGTITFDSSGALDTIVYTGGQPLFTFTPGNGASAVTLNLDFENTTGFSGLVQFAGNSSVGLPYQDGQAKGELSSFGIDEAGKVVGSFTNGKNRLIAQIALAQINNPEGLIHIGNNIYETSASTGIPVVGKANSDFTTKMLSGTLEAANVDLADEFAEMIIAQRAFQGNARVITVSDQFLAEVTQLKR